MPPRKRTQIIALLLTLPVFVMATKIRTPEPPRAGGELRICQYDTDSDAAIPCQFGLRSYDATAYVLPPDSEVLGQSPTSFSPPHRGPPAQP